MAIQLDVPNHNSVKTYRSIRKDIRDVITKQRCVVLDIGSNIELENQKIQDF